jgi:hypothetical protein
MNVRLTGIGYVKTLITVMKFVEFFLYVYFYIVNHTV